MCLIPTKPTETDQIHGTEFSLSSWQLFICSIYCYKIRRFINVVSKFYPLS